jgi:hypothetical protein
VQIKRKGTGPPAQKESGRAPGPPLRKKAEGHRAPRSERKRKGTGPPAQKERKGTGPPAQRESGRAPGPPFKEKVALEAGRKCGEWVI